MSNVLRRHPYTSVALAFALVVLLGAVFGNINVFQLPGLEVLGIEENEIGEILVAFLLVGPAFFLDHHVEHQRRHEAQLRAEQLRVLQVTMRTVQDIVNNNLNQLQLLRLEAEGHVSDDTLAHFDATIQDTAAQLTGLGNMTVFAERPMEIGSGVDVSESSGQHS
jgi:hypothetical protein